MIFKEQAIIVVQQSNIRTSSTVTEGHSLKQSIYVCQKSCWILPTNFHLLLFGVTKTIIIKVGNVVAFSLSLFSAVRAKLDSRYLQRRFSISQSITKFHIQTEINCYPRIGLLPVPVSKHKIFSPYQRNYRRRYLC
jgi:hypothetical protein